MRSLALPLLRVRRHLSDDDLLVVTLAALIDKLNLPGSLQEVLLVADSDAMRAMMVMRRAELFFSSLRQVGSLRAEAQSLRSGEPTATLLAEPEAEHFLAQLRQQQYQVPVLSKQPVDPLCQLPTLMRQAPGSVRVMRGGEGVASTSRRRLVRHKW